MRFPASSHRVLRHVRPSLARRASQRRRRLVLEELEGRRVLSAAALTAPANVSNQADEAALGKSIDAFALDLYAQLQGTVAGNLTVSPLSLASTLAMAYAGAQGETAEQMASVLHLGSDASGTESAFGELLSDLNAAGQSGDYLLSVANALWVQQGLDILPEFLKVMQTDFSGDLNQANFIAASDAARQDINNWVAQQTDGKITNLFPPDSLDKTTRLVLTDAVYFKANWASSFDVNLTSDASFTLASGSQVSAPTMHQIGSFPYMESDGFQVLELPYAQGRLAMDILLPTQSGLAGLGSNQIPADLTTWLKGLSQQDVNISLPKFQMTTGLGLIPTLRALGMTDAFTPAADFSGMTDERLLISTVAQKDYISVGEKGTEAAAATGIVASRTAEPITNVFFNADHPFLFLIRDLQSGSILFMGQVEDPTQTSDSSGPVITQQPRADNPAPSDPIAQQPLSPIALSAPAASSLSSNEKLVEALYQSLLGRAAEPAALTLWSKLLDGGSSRATIADDIEASNEYRHDEIDSLYQRYLGRAADTGGLDYFTAELAAGGTLEQIAATIAGSPEFAREHAGPENLVDALFTTALNRSVDAASLTTIEQELAGGATASQVAAQILASDEYQRQLAGELLSRFLDRSGDPSGIGYFAAQLHAGVTDEQVAGLILGSAEFNAKATGT